MGFFPLASWLFFLEQLKWRTAPDRPSSPGGKQRAFPGHSLGRCGSGGAAPPGIGWLPSRRPSALLFGQRSHEDGTGINRARSAAENGREDQP